MPDDPTPDARMRNFIGGLDERGLPRPMTYQALRDGTERWARTSATPPEISQLLQTSRNLFAHSYYEYEFLVVAGVWSLLAVEAALRRRLQASGTPNLQTLIKRAVGESLLIPEWGERLHAGRKLRNRLAHEHGHEIWSFGMSAQVVEASHEVVALLFPDSGDTNSATPAP